MNDIILHHYDLSPYGEKIRRILAFKDVDWASDVIPMVLPRPDLMELTGGYRRTPVLQIGADIYCDTKAIATALERRRPEPRLLPEGQEATAQALSHWGESSFGMVVALYSGLGLFPKEFLEDRRAMVPPGSDPSRAPLVVPSKVLQLAFHLETLERQLRGGAPFLLGDVPCLADFSAYHPIFFLERHPLGPGLLEAAPRVRAWKERIVRLDGGSRAEIESGAALAVARDASPAPLASDGRPLPDGLALGQEVVVVSEERGSGKVTGELVGCSADGFVVRRESERAGEIHVHFPRSGYLLLTATAGGERATPRP